MKFDSLKNKKIGLPAYLIAFAVILLLALLFGLIFGFNKGYDFNGGTQIVVNFGNKTISDSNLTEEKFLNEVSAKAKDIIKDNGGTIHSLQTQSTNSGKSLVITIREKGTTIKSSATIRTIRLELNKEFNTSLKYTEELDESEKYKILDDLFDVTRGTIQVDGLILPNTVIACIASLVFALTLVAVYACFRLKVPAGLTIAFGGLLDVLIFCALMILSRIEINIYFFALLGVLLLVSIYSSVEFFLDIKEKLKDPKLNNKTNKELATLVLKENFVKNVSIYAVCAGVALIVGLFGVVSILHLGLATILGLAVTYVNHTFILPEFWVLLNKKNELVRPVPKQKKEEVEVSNTKNNTDKSAEVVEIEEDDEEEEESPKTKKVKTEDDDEVVIEVLEDTDKE